MSRRILSAAETLVSSEERVQPRIGAAFQIAQHELQPSDDLGSVDKNDSYGECVWSRKMAEASDSTAILEGIVPHDRKEATFKLFHENNYRIDGEYLYMLVT